MQIPDESRLCYCGETEDEHDVTGRCRYCTDCDRFTYDEDQHPDGLGEVP